ncbi:MAG: acetamidase [Acidobacteria bacterium]|nr:acetamidase [Acidobacteriota bacterium]
MRLSILLALAAASLASAETHEVYPTTHSPVFTTQREPLAVVRSGDTIVTRTWDSGGKDEKNVWHIEHPYKYPEHGNPLTGPFVVEGAQYGDTLEVRIDKVELNRDNGYTSFKVSSGVFLPGEDRGELEYGFEAVRPANSTLLPWELDAKTGKIRPKLKPEHSSGFKIEFDAEPMLGCIGVAPPSGEVRTSGPSAEYGGNMDYNDIVTGATVLLPVFNDGAYLYVGDAHAKQGDGEGWGSGVETSANVRMTVKLHKGKRLSIPRLINDDYLVSIASQAEFSSSMDIGLRRANSDMLHWLTGECGLTQPEAHALLGAVVEHKIVTYYGSIATLIPKKHVPARCHTFE